ncbi:hypothetical protein [Persephonella sp.]
MAGENTVGLHEAPPESVLSQVGDMHAEDIIILLFLIFLSGGITYIFLIWRNSKKPPEERRSNFAIFLIALNVGFFVTVTFFVYRVLVIGIKYLLSH